MSYSNNFNHMHYRAIRVQIYTKFSENSQRKDVDLIKANKTFSNIINKDYVKTCPFPPRGEKKSMLHEVQNL